jgi:hypothetical protein
MDDDENQHIVDGPQTSLRRSTPARVPPKRYDDFVSSVSLSTNDDEPLFYHEVVKGSNSENWKEAMKDEMNSLANNSTW